MLKVLFGDVKGGRLARLPYLGYIVLLVVISMAIVFGAIVAVGGFERMMDGDIQQTQAMLMQNYGILGMILTMVVGLLLGFANINIAAKRIRDMGLPGWWTVLGIFVIFIVVGLISPGEIIVQNGQTIMQTSMPSNILQVVTFIILLLVPGNTFGGKP